MSIASLTERRIQRLALPSSAQVLPRAGDVGDTTAKTISDALSAVAAYVPTEVIAIYTLAISTMAGPKGANGEPVLPLWAYFCFLGGDPILVWLVFVVKKIATDHSRAILKVPRSWPYWEAFAAMIAFTVWSAAMPRSAFSGYGWFSPNIAGLLLVVVSLLLPLVGGLFAKVP